MSIDFKAPFTRLDSSMQDLRDYFTVVRQLERLRKLQPPEDAGGEYAEVLNQLAPTLAGVSWRRQYYSSAIIKLYGIHERFMRDLTEGAARFLSYIYRSYSDLPARLRHKHLQLTVNHLQELADRSPLDLEIFQKSMANLNSCFDGVIRLNEMVLSRHTSNFRVNTVRLALSRLDIPLPESATEPAFNPLLSTVLNGIYASPDAVIDDLADRRNEVAHGSDYEILDLETLLAMADVVYQYDTWILCIAAQAQLDGLVTREADVVGRVDHVWSDAATGRRTVARLVDVRQTLTSGSGAYLVSKRTTPCRIIEIQHDGKRLPQAEPGQGPYGVNLGVDVHMGTELKRIPEKWSSSERALLASLNVRPAFRFTDPAD